MKRDAIFLNQDKRAGDFEFNDAVADVFADMIERSVPFYLEQQEMIRSLCRKLWIPGTRIYDLGCSLGTTLIGLSRELPACTEFIGYDNSPPMLERAGQNIEKSGAKGRIGVEHRDFNGNLSDLPLDNAGIVTMCWTLQFVRPLRRDNLIRWIYDSLAEEGVLIVAEKILTNNGDMNRFFVDLYYDHKRQHGYADVEIARKREALENVLIPYRLDENVELFRRNGFELVETFFQWFNFAAFVCVKKKNSVAGLKNSV